MLPIRPSRPLAALVAGGLAAALLPLLALSAASPASSASDSDSLWTASSARPTASRAGAVRRVEPRAYRAYTLDDAGLARLLSRAPEEGRASSTVLSVPAPSGELVDFEIVDSPVMEAGLAAAHPELRTYAGRAVDSAATIRLDVTPMGFHASVRSPGSGSWYVDPAYNGNDSLYLSYLGSDLPASAKGLIEPTLDQATIDELAADAAESAAQAAPGIAEQPGDAVTQRTYRLALVTDQSYARYFGTANVLAEKVTLMNRVNQVYTDDLAIKMVLIDQTEKLNFDTAAKELGANGPCGSAPCFPPNADPAQGCTGPLLTRNRVVLGQLVGASAYDIGHIMLGISGGGVAGLGVVGGNGKAIGCTGLPQPEGDSMAVDYVAHEMGHQFSGNHTFNGTELNCSGGNRNPETSVEPGSGSSVMAYAGICSQDNLQPHSDPYFSQRSQSEIGTYVTSALRPINERQNVALYSYDTDGDSFTVSYDGKTSAPIVRGDNYTIDGIKAAIEAILPPGATVTVASFANRRRVVLDDQGFQVTFNGPTSPLRRIDVATLGVTGVSGNVVGLVGEVARGGPVQNGGFTTSVTANRTPIVAAPATKTIPLRTPFALTGSATDPDGDDLVYLWEQNDRGSADGTGLVDQTKVDGPLFRVFGTYADVTPAGTLQIGSPGENLADGSPTRTFPDLAQILANNTNATTGRCPDAPLPATTAVPVPTRECFAEWLPTADYLGTADAGNDEPSLDFRLTARDLDPIAGGTSFADTKLLIDPSAGPFVVSSKNNPAAAVAGRSEVVAWSVAGTDKPTLAPNVKISLSTDGGLTYPTVLATSTPNDGSEAVTWPAIATTTARIKIEAVGNVFFDVNNADFQITVPGSPTTPPTTAPPTTGPTTPPTAPPVVPVASAVKAKAPGSVAKGRPLKAKVTVAAPGVVPTGVVQVVFRGEVLGQGVLVGGKVVVKVETASLKLGRRKLVVRYLGTPPVVPSTTPLKVRVLARG